MILAAGPLTPQIAAASTDYATNCTVRLRSSPSTSATSLVSMPTGTIVTTTGTVSGGSWSATCGTTVSGSDWYAITAVNGTSVLTLYGVGVAYAATGLFSLSTSPPPTAAVYVEGIDVSHYQGTIDWPSVAAAGKRFAIVQATDGETCADPMYATNHAGARAAGTLVTAYHFAEPGSSPDEAIVQADWFVNNAALLPGDLVPALDLEQTGGLSVSSLQAWVGAWLGEVYAKLGVRPMIYSSPSFWTNSMGDTTMFADQGYAVLWIAHWGTSSPTLPAANWGGHGWTFWQYSSTGSTPGISGRVDLDRYNGSDLTPVSFNYTYVPPPPLVPPNTPPVLTSLTPNTVPAGGSDLDVTIQGANFACAVSKVYWSGTPLATSYVSPTQLTAVVPAALTATPGTSSVTVVNQTPGGATSAPAEFNVTGSPVATPPPVLTAIEPTTAVVGGGDLAVSVLGTNFVPGISTAYWDATPLATTFVSPTQLTAIVPAALTAAVATASVTVVNQPPGSGTSAGALFTVHAPLPVLGIAASSALGLKPATGYTAATPKIAGLGKYVTWKFKLGMSQAGQRVNVLVATRVGTTWGGPTYYKSAFADSTGVVTVTWTRPTAGAINVRVQLYGSSTYAPSTSPALGAYWR